MSSKKIQKIKEQILEALEEPKKFKLRGLVGNFYSLAIASIGIGIATKSLKEIKNEYTKNKEENN